MASIAWVLLVEDDADHRLLIREVISRMNVAVDYHEAAGALEGLEWIKMRGRRKGGLANGMVLLDLGLSGPSGFDFLEWVREYPELRSLPVFVLTASENPMDAEHAFNLGARGFFQKPSDFRDYEKILKAALAGISPSGTEGSVS
ncbi:MAG: response regulator [Gemmatimonadota bacterium]